MGRLDRTPQAPLTQASLKFCKLPNLPNLAGLGEFHGDGTVELHTLAAITPPPLFLPFFFLFVVVAAKLQ